MRRQLAGRHFQFLSDDLADCPLQHDAAIDVLGPEFRYETQVLATSLPDDNGRIFDDIYLVGGGDPVLMSRNYAQGFRPPQSSRTAFEDLAAGVVDADVLRVDGGVIAIERRYDDQRSLPGWPAAIAESGIASPAATGSVTASTCVRSDAFDTAHITSKTTTRNIANAANNHDVFTFGRGGDGRRGCCARGVVSVLVMIGMSFQSLTFTATNSPTRNVVGSDSHT